MGNRLDTMKGLIAVTAVWCAVASVASAGKPEGGPPGQGPGQGQGVNRVPSSGVSGSIQIGGSAGSIQIRFGDDQRRAARDYYASQFRAGHCPPGLAKKNNGCQPPGQVKAWRVGQALPGGVVVYPLPRDLEIRLGVPPAGHKYVRVAADILLIAVGTSMVIDAIEDLARL